MGRSPAALCCEDALGQSDRGAVGITVVIADDHALVREALRSYLEGEADIQVVGEASNGHEVLALMGGGSEVPDVVLMDVRMPGMDGLQTAWRIREQFPSVAVIMLSAYDDHQFVVEAVRAGALGYVLKTKDADHLVRAVRLVAKGNMIIDPAVVVALAERLSGRTDHDREAGTLTARELEVLQLLAFGHTNKEIASGLSISTDTVKTHLEHVFDKLGASDRTAAVAEALRRHLIE